MKPNTHLIFDHNVLCQHKSLIVILVKPLIRRFSLRSLVRLLTRGTLTRLLRLYQIRSQHFTSLVQWPEVTTLQRILPNL
jgi:hypothetical protein